MNVRKNVDYSEMYEAIDTLMTQQLTQMEQYCGIGKAVCRRTEKGAAVMASEYLKKNYPDAHGFSPRNLRRMRDFYRTYENNPSLLSLAMKLGWIQNVVIMEADLSMEQRGWYLTAALQFDWSKAELMANIAASAHEDIILAIEEEVCYTNTKENEACNGESYGPELMIKAIRHLIGKYIFRRKTNDGGYRRWRTMSCPIYMEKRIAFMRC